MADVPLIRVAGLSRTFTGRRGQRTPALDDVGFVQAEDELVAVVGPSGCGKTTLLRCLAGLERPDNGMIWYDGSPVTAIPAGVSIVFQDYHRSLFPWLTVRENVRFPVRPLGRAVGRRLAGEALSMVGLTDFADHHPWQLSGGMQQRVAIARAIVSSPRYLLMDEPFASVDAQTRAALEQLTLSVAVRVGVTVLLVTHDIDEAILMADRVLVLSGRPGRILKEVPIDLPRPRDEVETRALPRFQDYRREVHGLIGSGSGSGSDQGASGSYP
ncbi:ABC transporter ATP-binding protein [Actinoplanes sp. CA-252034]|uniref:ABC transporter ATP-binding protein n=1 Tax=Actinoplanes sp. CA-252034 TaxID=3239906 RepID=UPI003D95ADCA